MVDFTLSTLTGVDGANLVVYDWDGVDEGLVKAQVLMVHGLGEHAGRYDAIAKCLNHWGYGARAYDQYGHGESDGQRGAIPSDLRLQEDLSDVIQSTRTRIGAQMPLILFGHSLGGLVAAHWVAQNPGTVQGLVLSSPALALTLNPLQKLLLSVLPRLAPDLRMGNGLKIESLSHDPSVVEAYRQDPLVHDRISARLAHYMMQAGAATRGQAAQWSVPTLLLYAGADQLVNPAGSRAFAAAAPKDVVSAQSYPPLYHEIFNELPIDSQPVFDRLRSWLGQHWA